MMAKPFAGCILGLLCAVLYAASASAQRDLKAIPDPDPEIERRSFQVAALDVVGPELLAEDASILVRQDECADSRHL